MVDDAGVSQKLKEIRMREGNKKSSKKKKGKKKPGFMEIPRHPTRTQPSS
jgi:hypothetical protein